MHNAIKDDSDLKKDLSSRAFKSFVEAIGPGLKLGREKDFIIAKATALLLNKFGDRDRTKLAIYRGLGIKQQTAAMWLLWADVYNAIPDKVLWMAVGLEGAERLAAVVDLG
jgi:hypothetical protein